MNTQCHIAFPVPEATTSGNMDILHFKILQCSVFGVQCSVFNRPCLVYNEQGYSKHYYAGAERVSSRICGGTLYGLQHPINDTVSPIPITGDGFTELSTNLWGMLHRCFETCLDLNTDYISMEERLESVQESADNNNIEYNWYIYHSDHLGSSSFITDANGDPTQHLQYLPFGENYIEQRATTDYYTPYTFSAKERDPETGYSYFGARYYDPNVSVWLSVDPMADKYPSIGSFTYCGNNPVKFIDQKGQEFEEIECGNNKWQNFLNIFKNGSFWNKIKETIFPNYNTRKGEQQQQKKSEPTYEQKLDSKYSSWKIGESISGKELGDLIGMPEIPAALIKVKRVSKSNFEIWRTLLGKTMVKDSPIKIEKTNLTINGKSESVFRIQIDYREAALALDAHQFLK